MNLLYHFSVSILFASFRAASSSNSFDEYIAFLSAQEEVSLEYYKDTGKITWSPPKYKEFAFKLEKCHRYKRNEILNAENWECVQTIAADSMCTDFEKIIQNNIEEMKSQYPDYAQFVKKKKGHSIPLNMAQKFVAEESVTFDFLNLNSSITLMGIPMDVRIRLDAYEDWDDLRSNYSKSLLGQLKIFSEQNFYNCKDMLESLHFDDLLLMKYFVYLSCDQNPFKRKKTENLLSVLTFLARYHSEKMNPFISALRHTTNIDFSTLICKHKTFPPKHVEDCRSKIHYGCLVKSESMEEYHDCLLQNSWLVSNDSFFKISQSPQKFTEIRKVISVLYEAYGFINDFSSPELLHQVEMLKLYLKFDQLNISTDAFLNSLRSKYFNDLTTLPINANDTNSLKESLRQMLRPFAIRGPFSDGKEPRFTPLIGFDEDANNFTDLLASLYLIKDDAGTRELLVGEFPQDLADAHLFHLSVNGSGLQSCIYRVAENMIETMEESEILDWLVAHGDKNPDVAADTITVMERLQNMFLERFNYPQLQGVFHDYAEMLKEL